MGCLVTCVGVDGEEERPEAVNENNYQRSVQKKSRQKSQLYSEHVFLHHSSPD